jgi:hypothetical protein
MDTFTLHKQEIDKKLTEAIVAGVENGKLVESDLVPISDMILARFDHITTDEQLLAFLKDLASRWDAFSQLLASEVGKLKDELEKKVLGQVLDLTHSGNIDEAISLARTATQ